MITKKKDIRSKQMKGVSYDILTVGEKSMVLKMKFTTDYDGGMHSHPNEQSGHVISGKYRMTYDDVSEILNPGDSYSIKGNTEHAQEVIEEGEIIVVFSPPRLDYL